MNKTSLENSEEKWFQMDAVLQIMEKLAFLTMKKIQQIQHSASITDIPLQKYKD